MKTLRVSLANIRIGLINPKYFYATVKKELKPFALYRIQEIP